MFQMAPGACQLLEALKNSWKPYALSHDWVLPDGYEAHVKVMESMEKRIEVDELNHSTFTYAYKVNQGCEKDVKNAANVVHSVDAYILRSLIRRCNYDFDWVVEWSGIIRGILVDHAISPTLPENNALTELGAGAAGFAAIQRYKKTGIADITLLDHISVENIQFIGVKHLRQLARLLNQMLVHEPFPIITVHDDFKAHPNNLNHLRMHYREILAEIAESTLLSDLLTQLYGQLVTVAKLSTDLPKYIRRSNYGIC